MPSLPKILCLFQNEMSLNPSSRAEDLSVRRVLFCSVVVAVLGAVALVKLCHLQVVRSGEYRSSARKNYTRLVSIPPTRGRIYDRNGIPLAVNHTSYLLESGGGRKMNCVSDPILELETILGMRTGSLGWTGIRLQRSAAGDHRLSVNLSDVQKDRFLTSGRHCPGIKLRKVRHRFYPYGSLLSHVIGYVSRIDDSDAERLKTQRNACGCSPGGKIGKSGVERRYEDALCGTAGCEELQIDGRGRILRRSVVRPALPGRDIFLTIDLNLQGYVRSLVAKSRAAVVVLDPRDGAVRALVSSPDYDPNLFSLGISREEYLSLLRNGDHPLINRVVQGIYPPASTAKPYISISALVTGIVDRSSTLIDPGWWKLPGSGRIYRGWKDDGHGELDLIRALEESSDAFFYQLAHGMGIDLLSEWMARFGYGSRTGIDLPGEHPGLLPTREWKSSSLKESWYPGDTISVGIGQGYWIATPIQMAKALLTLINDGRSMVPHLVGTSPPGRSDLLVDGPKSDCWSIVKRGMYGVVHGANGTANRSFFDISYRAAAKSGTAQVCDLRTIRRVGSPRDEKLREHKMMIAFAPFDKPTTAVVVVLENGGADHPVGVITRKVLDYAILANRLTRSQILNLPCGRE